MPAGYDRRRSPEGDQWILDRHEAALFSGNFGRTAGQVIDHELESGQVCLHLLLGVGVGSMPCGAAIAATPDIKLYDCLYDA